MRKIIVPLVVILLAVAACRPPLQVPPDSLAVPPLSFSIPSVERFELANGMPVYFKENSELPLVTVQAVFRAGSTYDPPGREGLADITSEGMRTGGTSHMSGHAVDEILDRHAAILSVSMGRDTGTASLSVMSQDIEMGIRVFSDVVMFPSFETAKIEQAKEMAIEDIRRIEDNPQQLAFREFFCHLYEGDARGRKSTLETIESIERRDCVDFHRRHFYPANIMLAVTGNVSKTRIQTLLEDTMGAWQAGGDIDAAPPPPPVPGSLTVLSKEIPQSVIIGGLMAPGQQDSDYAAFRVLDYILGGGGFRSRIMNEIRNVRGLAYSAGSIYSSRPSYGVSIIYAMTKATATNEVYALLNEIVERVATEGVTEEELSWAKEAIVNNYIFSFENYEQIVEKQLSVEFHGLPRDYLATYPSRIRSVTGEDVRRVARQHLNTADITYLILGDEKQFDPSFLK